MTLALMPSQSWSQACLDCLLGGLLLSECPSFHRALPSIRGKSSSRLARHAFLLRVCVHGHVAALSLMGKRRLCCCSTRGNRIARSRSGHVCFSEVRCCFAGEEVRGGVGSQLSGGKCDSCYILYGNSWGDTSAGAAYTCIHPCMHKTVMSWTKFSAGCTGHASHAESIAEDLSYKSTKHLAQTLLQLWEDHQDSSAA